MQRFTKNNRCPICSGYQDAERGAGKRCFGFISSDDKYVNCTREQYSGLLDLNENSQAYVHRLVGDCNCGKRHDSMSPKKLIATYDYFDESGKLLYQVLRYEPKGFMQRRPDTSAEDGWSYKLGDVRRVLYNLQAITERTNEPVYVVEGEKDADTLISHGLLATTNAGGAGKWKDNYSEVLRERDVIIIPDHDEPGLDHANKIINSLSGVAKSTKLLTPPDDKKDITEWFESGGSIQGLQEILPAIGEITLPLVTSGANADERILLGTIITTPDILPFLVSQLKVWHFSDGPYQKIYKAMLAIDSRGEVVDVPTLFNELQSNPNLQGSGISRSSLLELTQELPALAQHTVEQALKRVKEAAHLRYMLKLTKEVERRIESGEHSAKDIYEFQNTSLDRLSIVTGVSQDFVSFKQMADDMGRLYKDLHEGKVSAVPTGFPELDRLLAWGGLVPKTVTILAAHTSYGKSSYGLELARRIASQGFEVAIFSLEMGKESLFMKVHSNISQLESHKIRPGMSNTERDMLLQTINSVADLPIYINDRFNDVTQIRSAIRAFVRTHKNVGAVIIDYLQLANLSTMRSDAQERERISEISKILKQTAVEYNVALIELSQFSRESYKEGREPILSDLYGSGSIEKDADNIWFIHGEKPDDIITIRELVLLFAKQRMGRIGRFGLRFDTTRNQFFSYSLSDENKHEAPTINNQPKNDNHVASATDENGIPLF